MTSAVYNNAMHTSTEKYSTYYTHPSKHP